MLEQSCINYLTFEDLSTESRRYVSPDKGDEINDLFDPDRHPHKDEVARDSDFAYPFLAYAINWTFFHASFSEKVGISQADLGKSYLNPNDKFISTWVQLRDILNIPYDYDRQRDARGRSLLKFAEHGMISCLQFIQESGACINMANTYEDGLTSLRLAAAHGHLNVVQLLIKEQNNEIDPDIEPLLVAIS